MSIFYWSNLNDGTVWSAQISDLGATPQLSNPQVLFSDFIETSDLDYFAGIFIDEVNKKFYWTNSGGNTIFVADISDPAVPTVPTNPTILLSDGNLHSPTGIFVDTVNSKLYWTNNLVGSDSIWVGSISDLANPTEPLDQKILLFISDTVFLADVCLDITYNKIYWSQSVTHEIWVGTVNPANPTSISDTYPLFSDLGVSFHGLFFDPIHSKLYWTDSGVPKIFVGNISDRANPVISSYSVLTSDNLDGPSGLFISGLTKTCPLALSDLHGGPVCSYSFFDISFALKGVSDAHCTLTLNGATYTSDFSAGTNRKFHVKAPIIASDYVATLKAYKFLNSDCSDIKTTIIKVKERAFTSAGPNQTVVLGSDTLMGEGPALSDILYTWSPSDGISDIHAFPALVTPTSDIIYTVTAKRIDISDCAYSDSVAIRVVSELPCQKKSSCRCNRCPKTSVVIISSDGGPITQFFSQDGNTLNISDGSFISVDTSVKTNIDTTSFNSDPVYAAYAYATGFNIVREANGSMILVNNGDITISSAITLLDNSDHPSLTVVSNKGSIFVDENITVPGQIVLAAPYGRVKVASGKTVTSTTGGVVLTDCFSTTLTSSDILTIPALTNGLVGSDITNTSDTISIVTTKNVVISSDSTITKNLKIITPGIVTTQDITAPGYAVSIVANRVACETIDVSNILTASDLLVADGGNISIVSQESINASNLKADGSLTGIAGSNGKNGGIGNIGSGGAITLIACSHIKGENITADGASIGGIGGVGGFGGDGGDATIGAGGIITLITCGTIKTKDVTVKGLNIPGTGGESGGGVCNFTNGGQNGSDGVTLPGQIKLIAYGGIDRANANTSDDVRIRNLLVDITVNNNLFHTFSSSDPASDIQASDVILTITMTNMGLIPQPSTTLYLDTFCLNMSDYPVLPVPAEFTFVTSDGLPVGASDTFTTSIVDITAGKFRYTAYLSDCPHVSDFVDINVTGTTVFDNLSVTLAGSTGIVTTRLKKGSTAATTLPKLQTAISDQVQQTSSSVNAGVTAIVTSSTNQQIVPSVTGRAKARPGSIVFDLMSGPQLTVSGITSTTCVIGYFEPETERSVKSYPMEIISQVYSTSTVVQPSAGLGLVSVTPQSDSIKLGETVFFNVTAQNTGPHNVSDAVVTGTSNLGGTFNTTIGFLSSDGTTSDFVLSFVPTVAGHHLFDFSINSQQVVNTNSNNTVSDIAAAVCFVDIEILDITPSNILPNLPFTVEYSLTALGGGATTCVTASISDIIYYQSDVPSGTYSFTITSSSDQTSSDTLKIVASDQLCYDQAFFPITVLDLEQGFPTTPAGVSDLNAYLNSGQFSSDVKESFADQGVSDVTQPFVLFGFGFSDLKDLWKSSLGYAFNKFLEDHQIFRSDSSLNIIGTGSLLDVTLPLNQEILLYLLLHGVASNPFSDIRAVFNGMCDYLSIQSDNNAVSLLRLNASSDFFESGAILLDGSDHTVILSCSDSVFFMTASDQSFVLYIDPHTSDFPDFYYSDNTQEQNKPMLLDGELNFIFGISGSDAPPPPPPVVTGGNKTFGFDLIGSALHIDLSFPSVLSQLLSDVSDVHAIFSGMCAYASTLPCENFLAGLVKPIQSDVFSDNAVILNGDHIVTISCSDAIFKLEELHHTFTFELYPFTSDTVTVAYSDGFGFIQKVMSFSDADLQITSDTHFKWVRSCSSDALDFFATVFEHPLLVIDADSNITDIGVIECAELCNNPTDDLDYICKAKTCATRLGDILELHFSDYASHISDRQTLLYEGPLRAGRVKVDLGNAKLIFYDIDIACSDSVC